MTTSTTVHGFPIPVAGDANNVPSHLSALFSVIEGGSIIKRLSSASIAALTSAEKPAGLVVFSTTTGKLMVSDGVNFANVGLEPVWTPYTPTLSQGASTNIAKTVTYAKYAVAGKWVTCQVSLASAGAGTSGAAVTVTLPVAAAFVSLPVGSGTYLDNGTALYPVIATLASSTTVTLFRADVSDGSGAARVGIDPNIAVAAVDNISFSISYEAA